MDTTLDRTWASDALERVVANAMTAVPRPTDTTTDEAASKIAEELGLTRQAMRYAKVGDGIHTAFGDNLLKDEELQVWHLYCPTRYVEGTPEFSQYAFDSIPLPVLTHWKHLKSTYAFDHFEIWTTEKTVNRDPLLIGVYQGAVFLLARWGKEAEDLLPYREVRERVKLMAHQDFDISKLPEKVASTVRWFQDKNILNPIQFESSWNTGRFFYRKHCGQRLVPFSFGLTSEVTGVCPGCGGTKKLGTISYYF